jgi:hypothetical protein
MNVDRGGIVSQSVVHGWLRGIWDVACQFGSQICPWLTRYTPFLEALGRTVHNVYCRIYSIRLGEVELEVKLK